MLSASSWISKQKTSKNTNNNRKEKEKKKKLSIFQLLFYTPIQFSLESLKQRYCVGIHGKARETNYPGVSTVFQL